ncbi:hypothetical protein TNIN_491691 [Trichonephila inaurata madagascariensis]|uniref:Secreted protein n=1 Tax=Trichonephila inaurata madagascariensis TaxID=2747483 RepID=A0A8X6MJZ1_9ARAC|nr:hypothetical protein TNIN_491691 [Trichonephila inaurata madagascariensis]
MLKLQLSALLYLNFFASQITFQRFSDSRMALQAISSIEAQLSRYSQMSTVNCRFTSMPYRIAMQWIPSHYGIDGNENANCSVKKRTKIFQTSNNTVPFL